MSNQEKTCCIGSKNGFPPLSLQQIWATWKNSDVEEWKANNLNDVKEYLNKRSISLN